ncbi:CMRF35-like molecule 8 [Silurus meridionalis]|uniref:CMRF35-like molecule 8 n=1 Tax=Silurus meridionalis TaxID=175797 RepID=UPI001EEA1593|nr:CMRF35-like molecule 8 [Silurus meridionalis]
MKSVAGSLGQNVTISCSYPEEFERNIKSFYKQNNRSLTEIILTSGAEQHQDDRFSISDDVRNKVFSVNINDVREDDGGVYFCAVVKDETEIISHSLFTTIHLQTTEAAQFTTKNPDVPSDTPEPDSPSPSRKYFITISVVVFVILLLGVGLALIFYQQKWKKSQAKDFPECAPGSLHKPVMEKPSEIPYYEEITDYRHHPDPEATAYYSAIPLSNTPSDRLISVYVTAQLPRIPYDSPKNVYATAQLPTTPSELPNTVYATAQLPTTPSDLLKTIDTTAELPTTPSDLPNTVYPTAQLPTTPLFC